MYSISAIDAILLISEIPPVWAISGCMISTNLLFNNSRYPHLKNNLSPVAISVLCEASLICCKASIFSGGTGSSKNNKLNSSKDFICLFASEGLDLP